MFPAGRAGVGLALVRVSTIAAQLIGIYGEPAPTLHGHLALVCWVLAVPLGLGLATIPCALVCFLVDIDLLATTTGLQARCMVLAALLSVSLVLLGPGAYSADARLFGRRVLVFGDKQEPRDR
jgi:hypothetical membrane protein